MSQNNIPAVDRSLPLHEQEAILSKDHNKGLHRTHGVVREIIDVSPELARVVLHIAGLADDPQWCRPNVSLRLRLTDGEEQLTRLYTVRKADAREETIEVDVVRHGESSPMMRWLEGLRIGDDVPLVGPRPHFQIPEAHGREALLFADASSIPALYALLAQAPAGLRGRGWVATADTVAFGELPSLAGVELIRIEPGTGFQAQCEEYGNGCEVVVWGAGERDEMRAVRAHFRKELGLAKEDVSVFGYWKRNTSNTAIDEARLRAYEQLFAEGGTVTELDDLALPI